MFNYNMIYYPMLNESTIEVEGNEEEFLALGEIDVYDDTLKSIITVSTEDFVKVVTDAMFKISNEYKFFYMYLKYSKVFYVPTYPSKMGINTMAVDQKKNLWMNVHFIYNECKMDKERVFGILFHELMHNFFKHQERENKIYPMEYRTKEHHMKCNICQDFEVNGSMVDDGIVPENFWDKMGGLYNKEYIGKRWEDILKQYGDKEYENWMKRAGIKVDEKTKKALEAIEKALKTLKDPESTDAEKERAGEILKKKMDEMYGKTERKIVDKADHAGLRREIDKLLDTPLADINDLESDLMNVSDDLKKHPKDMDDEDIDITIKDIKGLRKKLMESVSEISEKFRKPESETKEDINKAMKSLADALNTLHEGGVSEKEERKIIRQAKDDLEGIIMNSIDKKKRMEKREEAIKKHKEKLEKEKVEKEKSKKDGEKSGGKGSSSTSDKSTKKDEETPEERIERLKKKNPIKKFIDTFKNLQDLIRIDRISEKTYDDLNRGIHVLDKIIEVNIGDIVLMDVKEFMDLIPVLQSDMTDDLKKLKKKKILKMEDSDINDFTIEVFGALERFFKVLITEDEPNSVKFGAMSLAVNELRKLGKKLKTQKKIKPSKEWKEGYKETKEKLMKIYKEKGRDGVISELSKMGMM